MQFLPQARGETALQESCTACTIRKSSSRSILEPASPASLGTSKPRPSSCKRNSDVDNASDGANLPEPSSLCTIIISGPKAPASTKDQKDPADSADSVRGGTLRSAATAAGCLVACGDASFSMAPAQTGLPPSAGNIATDAPSDASALSPPPVSRVFSPGSGNHTSSPLSPASLSDSKESRMPSMNAKSSASSTTSSTITELARCLSAMAGSMLDSSCSIDFGNINMPRTGLCGTKELLDLKSARPGPVSPSAWLMA
mmetsp:Transcript_44540/g.102837  ORF Transcript_44540/g.102837 Transcript_44540/m.102837 type:complete len:257 (-) Transcript_44540:889-1659(-)